MIEMRSGDGKYLFTSESVTEGHPDKVCDQISDAILDDVIKDDPTGRVACETMAGLGFIVVSGEITTKAYVDVQKIVRNVLRDVGYDKPEYGFDYQSVGILNSIHEQSADIALGVDEKQGQLGAGDQGMMFGYATNETAELMPAPIMYAHWLTMKLAEARRKGTLKYLRPDGKSQVTVEYEANKPKRIEAVVIAAQHNPDIELDELREGIKEHVVKPVCGDLLDENTKYFINNTGRFVLGGPVADTGFTGRKLICDTYGGIGNHGGGAFSGKDPSKVDRTATYMIRYIAKNIVKAGIADRAEVQVSYAIGSREPINLFIDMYGTCKCEPKKVYEAVKKHFTLKPSEMIEQLGLRKPIFRKICNYGHFGHEDELHPWEKTDKAELLKKECGV